MSTPRRVLRCTHVRLSNWRNFASVSVPLQRRAILVGPNASGKSNFLDALWFLRDVVSVGGGFQAAVDRRKGVSAIRALAARRYSDIALEVHIGDDGDPRLWEYGLEFSQDNLRRPVIRSEIARRGGEVLFSRPNDDDGVDPERLRQTNLEQIHVNQAYREIADFFAAVQYLHIVPQLVREPDRSAHRSNDPYGGDFLERLARTQKRTQDSRLRRIRDALKIAVPQLQDLQLWRDDRGAPHLRGRYQHWRPQGAWQTEDQFSDGTLRLMGLLWAVLDGSGVLLLEEPELSLHPTVVRVLPQMLALTQRRSGRQVLMSTHSMDLLHDEGIGLDEVLVLSPSAEGTTVELASDMDLVRELLEGGVSLGDALMPRTRPEAVDQLAFFDR